MLVRSGSGVQRLASIGPQRDVMMRLNQNCWFCDENPKAGYVISPSHPTIPVPVNVPIGCCKDCHETDMPNDQFIELGRRSQADKWIQIKCPCCGQIAVEGAVFLDRQPIECGCWGHVVISHEGKPYVQVDSDCSLHFCRTGVQSLQGPHKSPSQKFAEWAWEHVREGMDIDHRS